MGKREGVFCDFTDRQALANHPCPNLAIGACVLCERDVCQEAHSFLRDKFLRPNEAGNALSITVALSHVSQNSQSIELFHPPQKRHMLVCAECGSHVPISDGINAAMDALITSLRSALSVRALKDASSDKKR